MSPHHEVLRGEQRRTILLVEDEPFVRDATWRILQNSGFDVISTANGQEALTAFESSPTVDLLISDVVLPGISGRQLARDLRSRCENLAILLTSGYGEASAESVIAEPGTYYLAKPYSRQSLLESVEHIFRSRRSEGSKVQAS